MSRRLFISLFWLTGLLLSCILVTGSLFHPEQAASATSPLHKHTTSTHKTAQAPPNLSIKLTHEGQEPFQPSSKITFHADVANAADAGPVINTTTSPNFIYVAFSIPIGSIIGLRTTGDNWNCSPPSLSQPNAVNCLYHGSFPIDPGAQLPPIKLILTLAPNPPTTLETYANVLTMYEHASTFADNYTSDFVATTGTGPLVQRHVQIKMSHSPAGPFYSGETVTYTATLFNSLDTPYDGDLGIYVFFPPDMSNIQAINPPTGFTCNYDTSSIYNDSLGELDCSTAQTTLTPKASVSFTFSGKINTAPLEYASDYTLTAALSATQRDLTGMYTSDTVQVYPHPDLITNITNSTTSPQVGLPISYTLAVSNQGQGPVLDGQAITANFTLPADISEVKASSDSSWKLSVDTSSGKIQATYTGTYPIPAGQQLTPITITGVPTQASTKAVASAGVITSDESNKNNNSSSSTTQEILAAPDLVSKITNNTTNTQVGLSISYTLIATNQGQGPVPNGQAITASFTPPDGVTNVKASDGSDWKLAVDAATWKVSATYIGAYPVKGGQGLTPITITGTATKANAKAIANATVATANESDKLNNASTSSPAQEILAAPDLITSIKSNTAHPQVGLPISYTLTVSNQGQGPVPDGQAITTSFTPPAEVINAKASDGNDWNISVDATTWKVSATYIGAYPVKGGQSLSPITIVGMASKADQNSMATASAATSNETDAINNSSTSPSQEILAAPDLVTSIANNAAHTQVGLPISYTLTVSNRGQGPVVEGESITTTFTPPAGLTNIKASDGSDWKIEVDAATGKVSATYIGAYPVAAGKNLSPITVTGISSKIDPKATATATVSTPNESNAGNNLSSSPSQDIVAAPDLITKITSTTANPQVGASISYTLTVSNQGQGPVLDGQAVTTTFTPPDGVTNVKASAGNDWKIEVDTATGKVTATYIGSYPVGPGKSLPPITITGTATKTSAAATATATVSTPNDSDTSNNPSSSPAQNIVAAPDLVTKITNDTAAPQQGLPISYTLTVSNQGQGPVFEGQPITASFTPPAGVIDVKTDAGSDWKITVDAATGKITATYIGAYPVAASKSLPSITITGTASKTVTKASATATVSTADDSDTANNPSNSPILDILAAPDLITRIADNTAHPRIGKPISYTVTVTNQGGPVPAGQPVTTMFTPPDGVTNIKAGDSSDWKFEVDAVTSKVTATYIGSYPIQAGKSLPPITLTGTASKAEQQAKATYTVSTSNDSAPDNNPSNSPAQEILAAPDLITSITNNTPNPQVGLPISHTLAVINRGQGPILDGESITTTFTPPDGEEHIQATADSDWKITIDSSTNKVTATYVGAYPVPAGQHLTPIMVTGRSMRPNARSLALATTSTPEEDNTTNNLSSSLTQDVLAQPDLVIKIANDTQNPAVGASIEYLVTVSNQGQGPVPDGQPITALFTPPIGVTNIKASAGNDWQITVDAATGKVTATYTGTYPVAAGQSLAPITITGSASQANAEATAAAAVSTSNESSATNDLSTSPMQDILAAPAPRIADASIMPTGILIAGRKAVFTVDTFDLASDAPITASEPVVVQEEIPPALKQIHVTSAPDWHVTIVNNMVTATYEGAYPIMPGQHLPKIKITGIVNEQTSPILFISENVGSRHHIFRFKVYPKLPPTGFDPR